MCYAPAHQNFGDSKVLFYTLSAHLLLRTSLNDYAPPFCFTHIYFILLLLELLKFLFVRPPLIG